MRFKPGQERAARASIIVAALLLLASAAGCERPAPPAPISEVADVGVGEDAAPPEDAAPEDAAPPGDAAADADVGGEEDAAPPEDAAEDVAEDAAEDAPSGCGEPGQDCPGRGEPCAAGRCADGLSCGLDGSCGGLGARCEAPSGCAADLLCGLSQCDGYAERCVQADRCLGPAPQCVGGACGERQLSVGQRTTCLLAQDGALSCWGANLNDEVNVPVGRYRAVSLGIYFTCAITDADRLRCWGDSSFGQASPPPDFVAREVKSGSTFACARSNINEVVCWGDPTDDLLVVPPGTYTRLSVGWRHACGLDADGLAACWGDADAYEGLPTTPLAQLSAGGIHGCGLTGTGEVVCWGFQDGRVTARPTGGGFLAVESGPEISCAIRADRSLVCWGGGVSFFEDITPSEGAFSEVAVGSYHACALQVDGPLVCWGEVLLEGL